jgi:hypothetical protein
LHLRLLAIELHTNSGQFDLRYKLVKCGIATARRLLKLKKFRGTETTHAKNGIVFALLRDPICVDLPSSQLRIVSE